jgi:hypothetical protein
MRLIKGKPARWVVPTALAAVLVAGLVISPAIGGPKFVTGKKVNKTIKKKTNATELRITGNHEAGAPFNINAPGAVVGSLQLQPGSYVINSTFRAQYQANQIIECHLVAGSATDISATISPVLGNDNIALSVTTTLTSPSAAQLRCTKGNAGLEGTIKNAEITALKVPKATVTTVP